MNFECHITVQSTDADVAEEVAKSLGWKTSEIARDPLLGDAVHFYLTKHASSYTWLHDYMVDTANILEQRGVHVIRKKIELIMYDTKTGVYA